MVTSIVDGQINDIEFFGGARHPVPTTSPQLVGGESRSSDKAIEQPEVEELRFGLKTIIQSLDLPQDEQIRGPMDGVFVLTGGPGVGKTTVALHRIPYLINEQNRADSWETSIDAEAELRFTADATLIVVWKKHLVQYLRDCVNELVHDFPKTNVCHIDNWATETLRAYVPLGTRNGWRLRDQPEPQFDSAKLKLQEDHIRVFLRSNHSARYEVESTVRDNLPQSLPRSLAERLRRMQILPEFPLKFASPPFSIKSLERLEYQLLRQLPEPSQALNYSELQQSELRTTRDQIRKAIAAGVAKMSQYVELLFDFYESEEVLETVGVRGEERERQYLAAIADQRRNRWISRADTYLLIWLIHLVTDDAKSNAAKTKPLPRYSHIVMRYCQILCTRWVVLGGGLVEFEAVLIGDALEDVGQ